MVSASDIYFLLLTFENVIQLERKEHKIENECVCTSILDFFPILLRNQTSLLSSFELEVKLMFGDEPGKLPSIHVIISENIHSKFQTASLEK